MAAQDQVDPGSQVTVRPAALADQTGPTCGQPSSLSSQFTFNPISYQNLLRAGAAKSTFSAEEVRLSLLGVKGEQHTDESRTATRAPLGRARLKLHSRCRSIGGGRGQPELLAKANIEPVLNGEPASAGRSGADDEQAREETKCQVSSQLASLEQAQSATDMSQTVQSIRSLSIQLNRAASQTDIAQVVGAMDPQELGGSRAAPGQQASAGFISSSSSKLSRFMGKKAGRMKEILLQNLGKAEKTSDEMFKVYEQTFYKQQAHAVKLQKEFKLYISQLASAHEASKSLATCIQQSTGEYQSARHDLVCENLSHLEHLQDDLLDKLRNQVLANMNEYLSQFNELRNKIAKRHRKLIDFDSSRRVYESMLAMINKKRLQHLQTDTTSRPINRSNQQQSRSAFRHNFFRANSCGQLAADADPIQSATNQLVDEARLLKLREQYNYCKIMYETINNELYEELPTVYEKKMKHLLMTLQNFFTIETHYHSNAGKLLATAGDVIDELPMSIIGDNRARRSAKQQVESDEYGKAVASGSSGMGSSRGESSLESSSSPDSNSSDGEDTPSQLAREEVEDQDDERRDEEESVADRSNGDHDDSEDDHQDGYAERASSKLPDEQVKLFPLVSSVGCVALKMEVTPDMGQANQGYADRLSSDLDDIALAVTDSGKDLEDSSVEPVDGSSESQESLSVPICAAGTHELGSTDCKHPIAKLNAIVTDPEASLASGTRPNSDCLYKVKTNYKYLAEDVDELCFEADEIIQVVEFDKTQEPEEGWLMGVREVNGQRGLFPANFTRPF